MVNRQRRYVERSPTVFPQEPQLLASTAVLTQEAPHSVRLTGHAVAVAVTVRVVVVTGAATVVVLAVMPQHEQALLYAVPLQESLA